jgi:hypothetical protein
LEQGGGHFSANIIKNNTLVSITFLEIVCVSILAERMMAALDFVEQVSSIDQ